MLKNRLIRKAHQFLDLLESPLSLSKKIQSLQCKTGFILDCLQISKLARKIPKTILDIGAYQGNFSQAASFLFPQAKIYAFEPIPECYQRIVKLQQKYPNIVPVNKAISQQTGPMQFYQNESAPSSSYKKMTLTHKQEFPQTEKEKVIQVKSMRLDEFFAKQKLEQPIFAKLDVQGAELDVLKSAGDYLKQIDAILLETSLVKLYNNSPTFHDLYQYLYVHDLNFVDILDKLYSAKNNKLVQFDALFIKNYS